MLLLISCTSLPQKLEVKTEAAKIERQIYQKPAGVISPDIKVIVVTPNRADEWNKEIAKGDKQPYVIFGYDEKDYLTFSQWLQDVLRYIKSQNAVIEAYEKEAKRHNDNLALDKKEDKFEN